MSAVKTGHFDETNIAYHPGVTTMWLAGLRQFFGKDSVSVSVKDLAFARWFIGVALLSGLVAAYFLLHRLFAFWQATFVWIFLAVNPFFLAQSRRVHTDALATTFIMLTVLLFILYCIFPKQRSYLIFSGITFGLACLTKSYSLILLLWGPICLFCFRQREHTWRKFFYQVLLSGIVVLNCSLLTVLVLWPIFWTPLFALRGLCLLGATCLLILTTKQFRPVLIATACTVLVAVGFFVLRTIWDVFLGVEWAVTTAHEVEHFFLGKVVDDPGWLFYPLILSIKSTPIIIPLTIGNVVILWKQRKGTQTSEQLWRTTFSILSSILLFMLCLSVTAKKFSRYLLPVFPMLDILAGIGLFYIITWIGGRFRKQHFRRIVHATCGVLVLLLTAVPVFALHPHYGTYYNICWKVADITKIITVGDASGMDIAAKYLNRKSNASEMSVQASTLGFQFFYPYFIGTVYQLPPQRLMNTSPIPHVDYEVVYIRDSQIKWVPQRGTQGGELEHVITLNGIDHVWIYRVQRKGE